MIKKIHFVRHGQTTFNMLKKIQGSSDISLNEEGRKQAENVTIKKDYDLYLHSGLKRSKETLDIIINNSNINNRNINKVLDNLIIERSYGVFEGLTEIEINAKYPKLYTEWKNNENVLIENSERIEDVVNRLKKFIKKIHMNSDVNIFAVTHSGFLYALYKYIKNINYGIRPDIYFSNCCSVYLELIYKNNDLTLKLYCDNGEIIEKSINISLLD